MSNLIYPSDLRIQITSRCNLYCDHCFASANEAKSVNELGEDEFLDILEDVIRAEVDAISITGGEPLIRSSLVLQMLNLIQDTPIITTLNTNGWLLDDEMGNKLEAVGLNRVQISLDSSVAERHDSFRRRVGSHTRAVAAIGNSASAGIASYARVTITPFNYDEMPEILNLVLDRGGQGIIVKPLVPSGRGGMIKSPLSQFQHKTAIASLIDMIENTPDIHQEHVQFLAPSFPFLIDEKYALNSDCCECGTGLAFISSDGNVQPCGYTHVVLGNLKKQSLEEIWSNTPFLQEWREKRQIGKCQSCEFVDICKGGCRAAAYETSGTLDVTDPLCWR